MGRFAARGLPVWIWPNDVHVRFGRRNDNWPDPNLVPYSDRHTFATKVHGTTGDFSLVTRALRHSSAQAAMIYKHAGLERVRTVMNEGMR